jgi:hypothetical protein
MAFDRKNFLSFIINPSGEVIPAMPHEEEFSIQQIRDHIAGHPEVICETCDGFLLFRNRDANAKGLPLNPLATSVYNKYARLPCPVNGCVFLAHPDHVPFYWRQKLHPRTQPVMTEMRALRQSA